MNYEESIIAYIDILGFKKYIEETSLKENQNELYRILFKFKDLANAHPLKRADRHSTHFSDLIIITCPITKTSIIDLINDLTELTHSFIDSKLLLRGIIIKGKILHQNGIIFGPGLIDAYLLEKDKVKFPRIIVDKELVTQFKLETETDSKYYDYTEKNSLLIVDPLDYEYFINYYPHYINLGKKSTTKKKGLFDDSFLDLIFAGLKDEDSKVKAKYQWMADWHNSYLTEFIKKKENDLEITKTSRQKEIEVLRSKFV
ncbi:MAG TPA: hypothetical protein VGP43_02950 [Chitinophagaceae bacterium]|nr:hypothetical protein [Chitinophagaceae bacterium]